MKDFDGECRTYLRGLVSQPSYSYLLCIVSTYMRPPSYVPMYDDSMHKSLGHFVRRASYAGGKCERRMYLHVGLSARTIASSLRRHRPQRWRRLGFTASLPPSGAPRGAFLARPAILICRLPPWKRPIYSDTLDHCAFDLKLQGGLPGCARPHARHR